MFKFTLLFIAMISQSLMAQTIFEIQGQTDISPYDGQDVSTSGIVTAIFGDGYYLQDGAGAWNGIYVYDPGHSMEIGDEVSLDAFCQEFYELTELSAVEDSEVLSSGNTLPEPIILNTGDVEDEAYEGVLIRVENAECTNSDLGFGEFELDDGSGPCRIDDLFYLFTAEEGVFYSVTGPLNYSFDNFKIEPRDEVDVQNASPLYYTKNPEEYDIETTSMSIEWQTNVAASSTLEYGLTSSYELGSIEDGTLETEHSVVFDGLSIATVYYIRVHSENGDDSTTLFERVVCTASASSGTIDVIFTQEVDLSVATVSEASWTDDITQTFVDFINSAENTLDITMYDTEGGSSDIFAAINQAHSNGVVVRYITDEEPPNIELESLNPDIGLLAGNLNGIMHDKFIVIDRDDPDNAMVVSGSTNHTGANLGWDYNNLISIQDQSLALAFTLEFEEMWGGDGDQPDVDNAKFSGDKEDNTPHKFNINGTDVELYFSPSDQTTKQIREAIADAENEIAFAIMAFTENSLGTSIADAYDAGLDVMGIIDYVEFNGSEFDFLLAEGVDVIDYQNADGTQWPDGPVFHHKYAILDYEQSSENPLTISGSHNWTASAESINDENSLFIYDDEVANWFWQEFSQRWLDQPVGISEYSLSENEIYPNPAAHSIRLMTDEETQLIIENMSGQRVLQQGLNPGMNTISTADLAPGIYLVRWANKTQKLVIQK
jgi:hypothetical protein